MKNIVIIGGGGHHQNILKRISELSQDEMNEIGIIDISEIRDIPCITTNNFNIINDIGYSKQKRKHNSKSII